MSNPMLDRIRRATRQSAQPAAEKVGSETPQADTSATAATAKPEKKSDKKTTQTSPAKKDAAAKTGGKSILSRMTGGKTGVNSAKDKASSVTSKENETSNATGAEEAGINPPPKKRGRPAKPAKGAASKEQAPTNSSKASAKPAKAPAEGEDVVTCPTLLIGCYPVQGAPQPMQLHELLEDVKAAVCEKNGVAHWGFIEFKSGALLAQALDEKLKEEGPPIFLCAEPFSSESKAVEQVLLRHYQVVIRGLR